ncbi:MAG: histone deacetylase [Leptospiraceae bacterium]|nr:histone deacetylase [Leptospiraceae bacterium]
MNLFDFWNKIPFLNQLAPKQENFAFIYSPNYNLRLTGHVFPAVKFEMIYELVSMDEELSEIPIFYPEPVGREILSAIHTKEYLNDLFKLKNTERTRYSELPLTQSLLDAVCFAVGGTILAAELTSEYEYVYNIGGGFHHSFADHAEGFCYLNDVAIASREYQKVNPEAKILIIDLDVHQGNGTASIFQNDNSVYTFSMHQENIYPKKEKSNLDVGLADGCKTKEYLILLKESLNKIALEFKPDLIFYLAGADPYEDDVLGGLKLTLEGLMERDLIVKKFCKEMKAKTVILTAGGYSREFKDTVLIHLNTAKVFSREQNGLF